MNSTTPDTDISTAWFKRDVRSEWVCVDHPHFYYDPDFESHCLSKIDELAGLGPNWDRQGAPALDKSIIASARQFVKSLPRFVSTRPMIVPLTTGAVQFEWHKGRIVLELEFETADRVHYLKWDPEQHVEEESTLSVLELDSLEGLIRWFMERFLDD